MIVRMPVQRRTARAIRAEVRESNPFRLIRETVGRPQKALAELTHQSNHALSKKEAKPPDYFRGPRNDVIDFAMDVGLSYGDDALISIMISSRLLPPIPPGKWFESELASC